MHFNYTFVPVSILILTLASLYHASPVLDNGTSDSSKLNLEKFDVQVAGHKLLLVLPDGTLAKPCTSNERQFYLDAQCSTEVQKYIPKYLGDLDRSLASANDEAPYLIRISNLIQTVKFPSIMDIKMGKQLHKPTASPARQAHMVKKAQASTNGSVGFRASGMRLFDNAQKSFVAHNNKFGLSLNADTVYLTFLEYTKFVSSLENRILLLRVMYERLNEFINFAQQLDGTFISTSFFFVFDNQPGTSVADTFRLHWIDFEHSTFSTGTGVPNHQFLFGVRNVMAAILEAIAVLDN